MNHAEDFLRRTFRVNANRHWFGRLVVATWAFLIPLFAFISPDSSVARAMHEAGYVGFLGLLVLATLSLGAAADCFIHDLVPGKLQQLLMLHRHAATMLMAIALVIDGGILAHRGKQPLLLIPFLLLMVFCVAVTALDLYSKSRSRCP